MKVKPRTLANRNSGASCALCRHQRSRELHALPASEIETVSPSHQSNATNPSVVRGARFTVALCQTRPHWCGLLGVRYAPIATKFCIAPKCRNGPQPDVPPIIVAVADLSRVGRRLFGLPARYGAAQPPRNDGRADGATEARATAGPSLTLEPSVTNNLRAN